MSPDEAAEFEKLPQFQTAITVRRYDDRGKDPTMITPPIEAFAPLMESFVRTDA
jgi:predicted HD phosphohydrolase